MKRCAITLALTLLLLTGCQSPMQKLLAKSAHWEKSAQHLAVTPPSDRSGLVREAFPNINNPFHIEIWNAIRRKGNVGDGFGWICKYNDTSGTRRCYLVILSDLDGHERVPYFYFPSGRLLLDARESIALASYDGDRSASLENVRRLVAHLSVLLAYEAFVVEGAADVPHTQFQNENPQLSFTDFLSSKGTAVNPPRFLNIEEADYGTYSECNVFVYMPCGGQLFRYQVRCKQGKIVDAKRFLVCTDIGDRWYIM